jgi:hypothetical protein
MDEIKYIENFSDKELEDELIHRQTLRTTLAKCKVVLRRSDAPPIHGYIYQYADRVMPAFVIFDNVIYRITNQTNLDGEEYIVATKEVQIPVVIKE